jgi:hypothetical protein
MAANDTRMFANPDRWRFADGWAEFRSVGVVFFNANDREWHGNGTGMAREWHANGTRMARQCSCPPFPIRRLANSRHPLSFDARNGTPETRFFPLPDPGSGYTYILK